MQSCDALKGASYANKVELPASPLFQSSSFVDNIILKEGSRGRKGGRLVRQSATASSARRREGGQDHILAEWLLLVVRYCLGGRSKGSSFPLISSSSFALSSHSWDKKMGLFANGHCLARFSSKDQSQSCLEIKKI